MLRAGRTPAGPTPLDPEIPRLVGAELPVRRTAAPQVDLWKDFGHKDLANTVRQICTLCGWTQIQPDTGQALALTSALEREGKSSIAWAMAIAMAQDHDGDILLLDCNLLHPSIGQDVGANAVPGLTEVLAGSAAFADGLRPTTLPNLWFMPAGGNHENPSRLLRSSAMPALMTWARSRFPFIILDLPAVLKSSDAAVLARLTDGVVLVVRVGATDQRLVPQALQLLSGVPIHGVVLNRWRSKVPRIVRGLVGM